MPPKTSSSRPDRSKTTRGMEKERLKVLDKIYWVRTFSAALAGLMSGILYERMPQPHTTIAILFTFYALSLMGSMMVDKRGLAGRLKVYLHGIGIYIILWFMMMSLYLTLAHFLLG